MRKISIFGVFLLFVWFSCTNDSFVPSGMDCNGPVNWDTNMRDVVERNCSLSGCHSSGSSFGDYTTYDGMSIHFGGEISNRVITMKEDTTFGMPPNYSTVGPKDLSDDDFMLMNCWITENFPEN